VGELRAGGEENIALVPQVSGKKDVRSDLTGVKSTCDVGCQFGVLQAYVVPCLHNTAHAHALGKESHDLFHVKDRAETWKAQYPDSLEYPMLSDFAIYERYVTQSLLPPLPHVLICWVWMLVDSLMEHNTNPH